MASHEWTRTRLALVTAAALTLLVLAAGTLTA